MYRMRIFSILTVGILGLETSYPALAADDPPYITYGCYQCHGFSGQGGAAGPRLAPDPLAFNIFAEFVRRPLNRMPAYSPSVLGNDTLAVIYEYMNSIDPPPAPHNIPLLSGLDFD